MAAVTAGPCHIACSRLRPRCVLAGLDPQAFRSLVSGTGATRAQMTWLVIVSRLQEGLVLSPTQARAEQSSYSHPAATLLCGSLILVTGPVPAAAVRGRAFWPSHGPTECSPLSFLTPDLTPNRVQSRGTQEQCAHVSTGNAVRRHRLEHAKASGISSPAVFKTVARPASWSRVGSTPMHLRHTLNSEDNNRSYLGRL